MIAHQENSIHSALGYYQSTRRSSRTRGYGPGAGKLLKRIRRGQSWESARRSVYPDGSFGNGGAMRAPAVGLFFATDNEEKLVKAAYETAAVTDAHPLGLEGAVLIALATGACL